MKLSRFKKLNQHLSFLKKCFTRGGFRHVTEYIGGLISVNKKTVKQISKASTDDKHQSLLNRILTKARFKQDELEKRYLKKVKYYTKGQETTLIFDDTLVKREGEKVEETQYHKDHSSDSYLLGHQFFTSMICTPLIQLPLLPKLYSKNTESKIEMASNLIDFVMNKVNIDNVMMDSWYSDKKIIKKCITHGMRVVCGIKTNRKISLGRGEWMPLSEFPDGIAEEDFEYYSIGKSEYEIAAHIVKLNGIPCVKMLTSYEWNEKQGKYRELRHLISTNIGDSTIQIVRMYRKRWIIETYHRDIKQNLGFAKLFLRKKEGVVRHAIYVSLAYAILKLFMFLHGLKMTIGECCEHIQDNEMNEFFGNIIEIEDKEKRLKVFEEAFIKKNEKL
ncbi:MAG: transposase [Nanoarchaeota archaeon]